jgi:hypothetical protein
VGKPLRRTLFRARVWRPSLVKAGMLGILTVIDDNTVRASWTDNTGATLTKEFVTERKAVLHIAKSCVGGLRFHDLRHSYATWFVDDGVPVNMVQPSWGTSGPQPPWTSTPGAPTITTTSCGLSMTTMTPADDSLTIGHDHLNKDRSTDLNKASDLG